MFFLIKKTTSNKVIKMLVLIVALFLLCWGPRLIMNVLVKLGLETYSTWIYNTRIICNLLSFVHSALNPFVYGFMSSNFRAMVCSSLHRRRKTNVNRQQHWNKHRKPNCIKLKRFDIAWNLSIDFLNKKKDKIHKTTPICS